MWPRRHFLKLGAVASATALVAPWALAGNRTSAAGQGGRHYVLVDGSLAPSVRFGHGFASSHRVDRGTLLTQWADLQSHIGAGGIVSGLTRPTDLPIIMQLVAAQGARVTFSESVSDGHVQELLRRMQDALTPAACVQAGGLPEQCRGAVMADLPGHTGPGTWLGWSVEFGSV